MVSLSLIFSIISSWLFILSFFLNLVGTIINRLILGSRRLVEGKNASHIMWRTTNMSKILHVLKHSKKNNFHLEISLYPLVLICDLFRSILAVKEVEFSGNTYYMSWTNVPATKKRKKITYIDKLSKIWTRTLTVPVKHVIRRHGKPVFVVWKIAARKGQRHSKEEREYRYM